MLLTETHAGSVYPFTQVYHGVRKKESRLYSDSEVAQLPAIANGHPHAKEWKLRAASASRLVHYLAGKKKPLKILEVGCGNGWLAARLASLARVTVLGLDPHEPEIRQARRIFKGKNLQFCSAGYPEGLEEERFDMIVFAASFQYFPNAVRLLRQTADLLHPGGEIHIIDTAFYSPMAIAGARERSRNYFTRLGWPAMAEHYFHHSLPSAEGFKVKMVFDPTGLVNRLFRPSPFPWIRLTKNEKG